jgi:hypothetical protein
MLRDIFRRWGLPGRIRVDNGHPWGSASDLPRDLALWWIGLGIGVIWNPPRRPQQNGKVERDQGVTQAWVEPWACRDRAELQRRLRWAVRVQREEYPAIDGRTRLEAFPGLRTPVRAYRPRQEPALWDEQRVYQYLAQGVWRRRADRVGQISLYNRGYIVGRSYQGQEIDVRLDAERVEWVALDLRGRELRRFPAEQLTRERIMTLTIGHRKPSRQKSKGA